MPLPTLSLHQEGAVKAARNWFGSEANIEPFYLGGFAGTGKSTVLPVIVDMLSIPPEEIAFCAPTGKAAKVMTEKLKAFGIGQRARTIHSWIYRPKPLRAEVLHSQLESAKGQRGVRIEALHTDGINWQNDPTIQQYDQTIKLLERDLDKAMERQDGPSFQLNSESLIRDCKLIVVDEASMVGTTIADDLISFGVPILCMGDPGQLPPVGDTPGLTDRAPDFFLTEIHRQAMDNPILRLATMARAGQMLKPGRYAGSSPDEWAEVVERRDDNATYNLDRNAQVIVGTHRKRWAITNKLRKVMGYKSTGPCAGEPLLICKNSRLYPDLVNGSFVYCTEDVGDLHKGSTVVSISVKDEHGVVRQVMAYQGLLEEMFLLKKGDSTAGKQKSFRAVIENEHVDFGHAITCHKSQGSQWDDVIVHDESGSFREDSAKWLYTAVTRAAKSLTVVL